MARWSWALATLFAVGVGGLAAAGTAPDRDGLRVVYRNDRLSGHVDAAPLREVLDAVAATSGAEIRGQPLDNHPVSTDLDAVPIDDALHRLLGTQNFTLSFGSGGQLKTVVLLGGPEAPVPPSDRPTAAGVAPPAPPATSAFPLSLSRAFTRHRPVPVPEQLAEALGADRATFPQLLEMATVDDDGTRRSQATQVVLSALEHESWLRRSFLRTLHDLDDASLQDIASGESGPRFIALLQFLAAHSREAGLQKKANVVLDQMQPPATDPGS
jgi:hypothetical protein